MPKRAAESAAQLQGSSVSGAPAARLPSSIKQSVPQAAKTPAMPFAHADDFLLRPR